MVSESTGIYLQAHGTTQAELNEARIAIEPRLIGFLAGRLSAEAIARLRAEVERQADAWMTSLPIAAVTKTSMHCCRPCAPTGLSPWNC